MNKSFLLAQEIGAQRIAELISLAMTLPTIMLACLVIWAWFPAGYEAMRKNSKRSNDWFIIGVVLGFVGAALDNAYWFLPWTASFLGLDSFPVLVNIGVYFNIFFRQSLGIAAAYCHLKSFDLSSNRSCRLANTGLIIGNIFGIGYAIFLICK